MQLAGEHANLTPFPIIVDSNLQAALDSNIAEIEAPMDVTETIPTHDPLNGPSEAEETEEPKLEGHAMNVQEYEVTAAVTAVVNDMISTSAPTSAEMQEREEYYNWASSTGGLKLKRERWEDPKMKEDLMKQPVSVNLFAYYVDTGMLPEVRRLFVDRKI